jgi:hypothetical protein
MWWCNCCDCGHKVRLECESRCGASMARSWHLGGGAGMETWVRFLLGGHLHVVPRGQETPSVYGGPWLSSVNLQMETPFDNFSTRYDGPPWADSIALPCGASRLRAADSGHEWGIRWATRYVVAWTVQKSGQQISVSCQSPAGPALLPVTSSATGESVG